MITDCISKCSHAETFSLRSVLNNVLLKSASLSLQVSAIRSRDTPDPYSSRLFPIIVSLQCVEAELQDNGNY